MKALISHLPLTLQESRSHRPSPAFPHIGQHNLWFNNKVSKRSSPIRTIQLHQDTLIRVWNTKEIIRPQYNGLFSFPQVCFVSYWTPRLLSEVDVMQILTINQTASVGGSALNTSALFAGKRKYRQKIWSSFCAEVLCTAFIHLLEIRRKKLWEDDSDDLSQPSATRFPSKSLKSERPLSVNYGRLFPVRNYDTESSFNWVNLCLTGLWCLQWSFRGRRSEM